MGIKNFCDKIDDVKLCSVMDNILLYHDVYFNDEGEHWTQNQFAEGQEIDFSSMERWYEYDPEEYGEKVKIKNELISFFDHDNADTCDPAFVRRFMREINMTAT